LSTLYIHLASRALADSTPRWFDLPCSFALVEHGSAIERQGLASLSGLAETIAKAKRVVLLLAASDVTLLHLQVPPLSPARLKAALPNLVEEHLITDPADCIVVAGSSSGGLRTIAVVQRAWLDLLAKTFAAYGARQIAALPAQLCLQHPADQPGSASAAINILNADPQHTGIDITLRLSEHEGIGLAIQPVSDEAAPHDIIRVLSTLAPEAPITLYVPQPFLRTYQDAASKPDMPNKYISVVADNWSHWLAGVNASTLDLMAGLGAATGYKLDWRPWRWPLALAAAVLAINAAALNIDWWRMQRESNALRAAMTQIYKSAYPKETVIIDPVAQMQQKISAAKRNSGLPAADDFTAITAAFGEAWINSSSADNIPAIAALEYRERSLMVRLKPALGGANGAGGAAPTQQIKAALAKHNPPLTLEVLDPASGQSGGVAWKIRSAP